MWRETALSAMRKMQTLGLNDFDIIMVPGHFWHDELSAAARVALAKTFCSEGLRIESVNLPALDQNLVSCIPEARAYAIALYTSAMQLGADVGSKGVVVVPGRVSGLFPPPQHVAEGFLRDGLEQLLRVAECLDMKIFIESHPQTPIPTVDKIEKFLATLEHPRLLVAYDVSNAEFVSEDQPAALRRLAPRLGQVHLSDGTTTRWRHDRVGLGTVNFVGIAQTLKEINFSGLQVLEIISEQPLEDIAASMQALASGVTAAVI